MKLILTYIISFFVNLAFCSSSNNLILKTDSTKYIETSIGEIIVYQNVVENENTPLILLHGLFFDHQLWDYQTSAITDRSVYVVDMPIHGKSHNIKPNWTLEDCATVLLEILEKLAIQRVHAVGHSWGGMTILRAAESYPDRFESISFFNTPFEAYTKKERRKIKLQHTGLIFKQLFIKVASKSIFASKSLESNPELFKYFKSCMQKLSNREIKYLNKVVRINAKDKLAAIKDLKIKHQIIIGKEDKIATAPASENVIFLEGGHTSPLEYPEESLKIILSFIN